MKFYSEKKKQMVFSPDGNHIRFVNGEYSTNDEANINKLKKLGYRSDEQSAPAPATPPIKSKKEL